MLKKHAYYFALLSFVGIVMIDPTNKLFNLKEIAFVGLLFLSIVFSMVKLYKEVVLFYLALVCLAVLSVCSGIIVFNLDIIDTIPYFKALMFGVVFITISKLDINTIIRVNYIAGLLLSIFISLLIIAFVSDIIDMSGLLDKMADSVTVMIAKRDLLGMEILMFFYKTMPFCFFALIYALRNKKIIPSIIILAPIVYGGSRTPMLVALAIVVYLLYDRKNKYFRYVIGLVGICTIIYFITALTSTANVQEGDEMKSGVASYLFNNSSIFSHGVGAKYWDPVRKEITNSTEMTYFEMLYQYGWILFPFVIFIFFRPFFVIFKKKHNAHVKDFAVAYLLYLINAGTNPLLINSTGMWVFACALVMAVKVREKQPSISETKFQLQAR